MKKNPQHLWVLQFGAGNHPPHRDTHRAYESWPTTRRAWEKRGTCRPYCQGSSRNTCKMQAVPAELGALISAVRACEDLQMVAGDVKPMNWRLAKAGAQAGAQEYASPVMLRNLVEKAVSESDQAVVAMALISYVCFLRVAEAASVRAGDVRDSHSLLFWNTKTGTEGWQRRPVPPWLRPFVEWVYDWATGWGRARDDPLFPAGSAQPEKKLADMVHGTTWSQHRWHCLRRGGAAACWRRGPALPHFKWW